MAKKGLREPRLNAVAVLDVPALDDAQVDVAARTQPTPYRPGGVIMVDDFSGGTADPARGFDDAKVLGVVEAVLDLDPVPGLVAVTAQSHSVFRRIEMNDASPFGALETVEAQA